MCMSEKESMEIQKNTRLYNQTGYDRIRTKLSYFRTTSGRDIAASRATAADFAEEWLKTMFTIKKMENVNGRLIMRVRAPDC